LQTQFGLKTALGPELARLSQLIQGQQTVTLTQIDALYDVRPPVQDKEDHVSHRFDKPVANGLVLDRVLSRLGAELAGRLQAGNMEARTIVLRLEVDEKGIDPEPALTLSCRTATADPQKLVDSLRALCRQGTKTGPMSLLRSGISAIHVTLTDLTPAQTVQLSLFEKAQPMDDIQGTFSNIITRHKTASFFRPVLTNLAHPLPERRFDFRNLAPA
jgi:hypothetical protein